MSFLTFCFFRGGKEIETGLALRALLRVGDATVVREDPGVLVGEGNMESWGATTVSWSLNLESKKYNQKVVGLVKNGKLTLLCRSVPYAIEYVNWRRVPQILKILLHHSIGDM